MHPNFKSAGQKVGVEIWRIENFEPVPYPASDFGKFYVGDSYIILNTYETKYGALQWDVHFWLGLETTQDEAGAAAYLTVQLDDQLGGAPVQHREVQEHESQIFSNYFKNGIRYMPGGVASGFQHVNINDVGNKRLFEVKGKTNIRVRQVAMNVKSMNTGDCYILDAGDKIYVYVGKKSKRLERMKAISAANQIRDQDHKGRSEVFIIDEFTKPSHQEQFFGILGSGTPSEVSDESSSEDDEAYERAEDRITTLYKVSDASGELKVETVAHKPLKQDMLKSEDCFILDTGRNIYVWVGKKATDQEKTQSMARAQGFLTSKQYPTWTKVTRIVEGAETALFKINFASWRDKGAEYMKLLMNANENITEAEFDPSVLHKIGKSGGAALSFMPDNGEGTAKTWRVVKDTLVQVEANLFGTFFSEDAYVVHYECKNTDKLIVIYYWQGLHASSDVRAVAAFQAEKMNADFKGKAVIVRVVEGFEPRHLLKIFKGKLVVFSGSRTASAKNSRIRLFRVRGTCAGDVRATQMPGISSSLSSDDAFVLEDEKVTYIWNGTGASAFERSMAESVAKSISPGREFIGVEESKEPVGFWNLLGGQGMYDTEVDPPGPPILDARLFHCKINFRGKFKVEEITNFGQGDLDTSDIMVLDGGDEVYIWIGSRSTDDERTKSLQMAQQYLKTDPTERSDETCPLITISEGSEPISFKKLFPVWNDKLWEKTESYEDFRKKLVSSNKNAKAK